MPASPNHAVKAELPSSKPYVIVGAGRLSAAVWRTMTAQGSPKYRFNIFALDAMTGTAGQSFSPEDLIDLAKLAHVLAAVIVDDGGVEPDLRQQLNWLIHDLELVFCTELE